MSTHETVRSFMLGTHSLNCVFVFDFREAAINYSFAQLDLSAARGRRDFALDELCVARWHVIVPPGDFIIHKAAIALFAVIESASMRGRDAGSDIGSVTLWMAGGSRNERALWETRRLGRYRAVCHSFFRGEDLAPVLQAADGVPMTVLRLAQSDARDISDELRHFKKAGV